MSGISQVPQNWRTERAYCGFGKDNDCLFVLCKVRWRRRTQWSRFLAGHWLRAWKKFLMGCWSSTHGVLWSGHALKPRNQHRRKDTILEEFKSKVWWDGSRTWAHRPKFDLKGPHKNHSLAVCACSPRTQKWRWADPSSFCAGGQS